jgi:FeS assembly protein IscX
MMAKWVHEASRGGRTRTAPENRMGGMEMKWTDSRQIAVALADKYPDTDPKAIRFTDLHGWVMGLEGFSDTADRSGEKILEAIQMAWIEEVE